MDYVTISTSKPGRREIHFFTDILDDCEKVRIVDDGENLVVIKQYMIVHKQSISLGRTKGHSHSRTTFICEIPIGKYYLDEKQCTEDLIVIPYKFPVKHSKDEKSTTT